MPPRPFVEGSGAYQHFQRSVGHGLSICRAKECTTAPGISPETHHSSAPVLKPVHVNGEVLESAHEVGADADGLAGELDGLEPGHDLFEFDLEREAGQMDAEAVVLTDAEALVSVGCAGDVVAERLGKLGVVPNFAGGDRATTRSPWRRSTSRITVGAVTVRASWVIGLAQRMNSSTAVVDQAGVGPESRQLVGSLEEREHPAGRCRCPGGVKTAGQKEAGFRHHVFRVEWFTVDDARRGAGSAGHRRARFGALSARATK